MRGLRSLTISGASGEEHLLAPVMAVPSADESAQPTAFDEKAELAAPGPVPQNAFAPNRADAVPHAVASPVNPMMSLLGASATRGPWRVSADGHLEHRVSADEWTRVLADKATTFHVVSVVETDVWAGGSDGALFHSDDGGDSWSRVAIAISSGAAETGTIVSIRFSDSQHGTVSTGGGSRWSTSDGGVTWTSQ